MIIADTLLRGSIIGVVLMIALVMLFQGRGGSARLSPLAFLATLIAYLIIYAPTADGLSADTKFWLAVICGFMPASMVCLSQVLLLDQCRLCWVWPASALLVVPLCVLDAINPAFHALKFGSIIAVYLSLLIVGLATWRDDLDNRRRQFRTIFLVGIAFISIFFSGTEYLIGSENMPIWIHICRLLAILSLALVLGIWLLSTHPKTVVENVAGPPATPAPAPVAEREQDGWIVTKLNAVIDAGIWQREGLTISTLATEVGVPEYRLRETINQHLGYRNFPAFINSYRIKAAKDALSSPQQSGQSILEIAYACGFASLGPFNRAFRDATGQSPREFRQAALDNDAPIFEKTNQFVK